MRVSTLHQDRSAGRTSPVGNEGAGHSTTMRKSAQIMEVGIERWEREREERGKGWRERGGEREREGGRGREGEVRGKV